MKRILTTCTLILLIGINNLFACHNTVINTVTAIDNGDGTYTYTIGLTVDVGSLDGYSYGFALVFAGSAGTPVVQPGFTPTVSRAGYNDLTGYTGANIGNGLGGVGYNYFDDRYANRTDVLTYETDDGTFGMGSTDYTKTVVVTVDGCVETISLDGDFRSTGSSTPAGVASCIDTYATGISCAGCTITGISSGTQTACNTGDNSYTQQVTVTYSGAPGSGTLDVNGQSFAITASPQTVTLVGLNSDGANVNVTAAFSADGACTFTQSNLFTAPANCVCGADAGSIN